MRILDNVKDAYDAYNEEPAEEAAVFEENGEKVSSDVALLECLDNFGLVDILYISKRCGLAPREAAEELKGAIFQDPAFFEEKEPYDIKKGWVSAPVYCSGNVIEKQKKAIHANIRFPGAFENNIEALKKIVPEKVGINDIHISLGAPWIPADEIRAFINYFLKFKFHAEVTYYPDLKQYKVRPPFEGKTSVLNNITYGVPKKTGGSSYLTALEIIEDTLNARTVKVYDYVQRSNAKSIYDKEGILNIEKTIEAQEKQRQIEDAFRDYVYSSAARIRRYEEYYNEFIVGYTYTHYDGGFLKLSDLNPEVTLYKHQRDAVARVLLSDSNLLLAHDVGTGKTYEMIVSVHELKRMGRSRKNLLVFPKSVLEDAVQTHRHLYPGDSILAVYPKDFVPAKRQKTLEKIRDGEYVAIYMGYGSFDMIGMSKSYYIDRMTREYKEFEDASYNASDVYEKNALKAKAEAVKKKLSKFIVEADPSKYLSYDALGIDTLVVDEAHNYKNIPIDSHTDGIIGMGGTSTKGKVMLEKAHYTPRLIFSTGTPLTNSLADLFTFQTYLQPATLAYHKIGTFDAWISTFGKRETNVECDVDANAKGLRLMTRFSSFHNLAELMGLFSQVCDFHHMEPDEEGLPDFDGPINITVPIIPDQKEYIQDLSKRTDDVRKRRVGREEDNLLKITTDGRKAALDIRLVNSQIKLNPWDSTKTHYCAVEVFKLYRENPGSVQIVFSDIGTPRASGFNIYDLFKDYITALGVPKEEIAFIHDAANEKQRCELFRRMNSGEVRVVVGSTAKLGVGVNVQEKLLAIHHLSVPWRPADMVQRLGRILRKGNTSEKIFEYRYITSGTFDAYSWQILESKQKFISSFLSGTSGKRDSEDIADAVLSYAEVKALAIGNPLLRSRFVASNELERLKIACRTRQRELQDLQALADSAPEKIKDMERRSKEIGKDALRYTVRKERISNEERINFGEELLLSLKENKDREEERVFDRYQGFGIILPAGMCEEFSHVILQAESGGRYICEMRLDRTPLSVTKAIDRVLEDLLARSRNIKKEADLLKKNARLAKADIAKGNAYIDLIEKQKAVLAKIDKQLEDE